MEEKLDHVVLGEELGDGGERVGVDLVAGFVDGVFFVRAPELIDPAEGVVGLEDGGGQLGDEPPQGLEMLRGEGDAEQRIVGPEDLREQPGGVAHGEGGAVGRLLHAEDFRVVAVLQRDGRAIGHHQEVVLGEEAGEEELVPMLVGAFEHEAAGLLRFVGSQMVAKLSAAGAEGDAVLFLVFGQMRRDFRLADAEPGDGRCRAFLGELAGGDDDAFEPAAEVGMEGWHESQRKGLVTRTPP